MPADKWISIDDARELIIDRRLENFVGDATMEAYWLAWKAMVKELESGQLPSRPENPEDFHLTFASDLND